jgi:hypothetical protein
MKGGEGIGSVRVGTTDLALSVPMSLPHSSFIPSATKHVLSLKQAGVQSEGRYVAVTQAQKGHVPEGGGRTGRSGQSEALWYPLAKFPRTVCAQTLPIPPPPRGGSLWKNTRWVSPGGGGGWGAGTQLLSLLMGWVLELHQTGPAGREPAETSLISRDQGTRREEEARPGQGKTGKTEIQAHPGTMATLPSAASPSWQPLGPEDEDASLDQYDLYSLAHPYIGKGALPPAWPLPRTPPWTPPPLTFWPTCPLGPCHPI